MKKDKLSTHHNGWAATRYHKQRIRNAPKKHEKKRETTKMQNNNATQLDTCNGCGAQAQLTRVNSNKYCKPCEDAWNAKKWLHETLETADTPEEIERAHGTLGLLHSLGFADQAVADLLSPQEVNALHGIVRKLLSAPGNEDLIQNDRVSDHGLCRYCQGQA
jgi:hypothetical protein